MTTTRYNSQNIDLGNIFQKYTSGPKLAPTRYYTLVNGTYKDLSDVFQKYTIETKYTNSTGYNSLSISDTIQNSFQSYNSNYLIYTTGDGTEAQTNGLQDKIYYSWTVPVTGSLKKFSITASGGTNNSGYINWSLSAPRNQSFGKSETINDCVLRTYTLTTPFTVNVGEIVYLDWSTMAAGRLLNALVINGDRSKPVLIFYLLPS